MVQVYKACLLGVSDDVLYKFTWTVTMTLIFTVPEYVHEDCLSEKMLTGKIRTEKGDLLYASLNVSAMHPSG